MKCYELMKPYKPLKRAISLYVVQESSMKVNESQSTRDDYELQAKHMSVPGARSNIVINYHFFAGFLRGLLQLPLWIKSYFFFCIILKRKT